MNFRILDPDLGGAEGSHVTLDHCDQLPSKKTTTHEVVFCLSCFYGQALLVLVRRRCLSDWTYNIKNPTRRTQTTLTSLPVSLPSILAHLCPLIMRGIIGKPILTASARKVGSAYDNPNGLHAMAKNELTRTNELLITSYLMYKSLIVIYQTWTVH